MPHFKAPSYNSTSTSTSSAASSESSSSDNAERNEALALQSGFGSQLQPHHPDQPRATTTTTTRNTHDYDSRCVTIAVSRSSSSATARSSMYSDTTDSDSDSGSRTDIPSLPCSSSISATSSSSGTSGSNAHLLHQHNHRPRRVTGVPTTGSELTFSPLPSSSTKHHLQGGLHLGRETIKHKRQRHRQLHRLTRDISTLTRAARVAGRYSARRVQRSLETLCGVLAVLEARERRRREIRKGKGKGTRELMMGMGMGTGIGSGDDGDDGLRREFGFVDDGGVGGGAKVRVVREQGHGHRRAGEESILDDEVGETRARRGPGAAKVRKWLRAVLRT